MDMQRKIQNGPSNFDLMMSLFDGKVINFDVETETKTAGHRSSSARFTINEQVGVRITSLEHEDGSGVSWIYKGIENETQKTITGWYNSANRSGYVKIGKKFQIN